MDRISELHDELIFKILTLLPAKDVVTTMVLSKRWQFLWTLVPKFVYDDGSYGDITEYGRYSRFVDRSLLLHKAPILETLHFKVSQTHGVGDIEVWTRAADKPTVRKLIIEIDCSSTINPPILPRSLYSGCRMLVTLKLNNTVLVDFSSPVSFPSLRTLSLESVKYPSEEFVKTFLSYCHVLEWLIVLQCPHDNVTSFTVRVPSLKRLLLLKSSERDVGDADGFVIDAPSLKMLFIFNPNAGFCVIENEMPETVEANILAGYWSVSKTLGSITSLNRLSLCLLNSKDMYPVGIVFHSLEHLMVCTCEPEWLNVLMCVLRVSPNLQSLLLKQCHDPPVDEPRPFWIEPSSVPKCLLSSFETFKWMHYEGREEEKQVLAFILRNGSCLKKVTISSKSNDREKKLEMVKELSLILKASPNCALAFD